MAAGEKATAKLNPEKLCFSNLKADLAEESKRDNLKVVGDDSQQDKKEKSGPNVGGSFSGLCVKENKVLGLGLGLDLTKNMENNLFSVGPPSPKLKAKGVCPKARASQVKKAKQVRKPCTKENVGCMETEGAYSAKDGDYMEVVGDTVDVGEKRKECSPLGEINMVGEANKKIKQEVEVMALGRVMKQHLGSAAAAW